ncbi:hypothetical protein MES4922_620008 [Mesorhizobium ventifaucium]|uniref:Transposase n=1 Tax=Mesorhizobium ventifaucium TaxID=666020 RepID=A0ABN8KAN6_9HYPH|nr:hypothetical protein MES4922_620008 [Mesorhizobium ventifaucium]
MQWHLVAHCLEEDRVLINEHDRQAPHSPLNSSGQTGRTRANYQELGLFLEDQLFPCNGLFINFHGSGY